jgi:hypothetical protein
LKREDDTAKIVSSNRNLVYDYWRRKPPFSFCERSFAERLGPRLQEIGFTRRRSAPFEAGISSLAEGSE